MKNKQIIFITVLILMSGLIAQTYGQFDLENMNTLSEEVQTLQSFEESFAFEKKINPDEYILGPGDELGLNILTGENITYPLKVTPTGDLFIPSVGIVHVSGMTLSKAIKTIEKFIHTEAFPGAKVSIALVNVRTFLVQVTGAVNSPKFVNINAFKRLSNVLGKCKGSHQFAREFEIVITRQNGDQIVVNYLDYLRTGNLENNPTFLEGDRIHVPFGDVKTEGVVLRGASTGNGYDLIEPDEMLGEFLRRRVKLHNNADLNSISITRTMNNKVEYINIKPENLFKVILKAGDTIDILWEKGVMVNGFVLRPGGFKFFPGYVAADYVNMAGGNSPNGSPGRCKVLHKDGTIEYGQEILIRRGDVIIVPRTYKDVILGSMSSLEIVVSLATIYLTFIATQN